MLLLLHILLVLGGGGGAKLASAVTAAPSDAAAMVALSAAMGAAESPLNWSPSADPCSWGGVRCGDDGRVSSIQAGNASLSGALSPAINNLTLLTRLELQFNSLTGELFPLSLPNLAVLLLHSNNFSSIAPGFFTGLTALTVVFLDSNPFAPWTLPAALPNAESLVNFSANSANVTGTIPEGLVSGALSLTFLGLAFNNLSGELPQSFSSSPVKVLWLNNQNVGAKFTGNVGFISSMTGIQQLWLQSNALSGPLPDMSNLTSLEDLDLRDNSFTGPVPTSLLSLQSLKKVVLTNNFLQGAPVAFPKGVVTDFDLSSESFCSEVVGSGCDPRVNELLAVAGGFGYPVKFAESWKGDDPCARSWIGVNCDAVGNVTMINFKGLGLTGIISPAFANFSFLRTLVLADNNISGTIPRELAALPELSRVDVSNNNLYGKLPSFRQNVIVNISGNVYIGKNGVPQSPSGPSSAPGGQDSGSTEVSYVTNKKSLNGVISGSIVAAVLLIILIVVVGAYCYKRKQKHFIRVQSPNTTVIHPRDSGSYPNTVKITIAGANHSELSLNEAYTQSSSGCTDLHVVEAGNMVIAIQMLRDVTNNFNEANVLGRGGFGTVYMGEYADGTKLAVKRMEAGVISNKGLTEFKSEIAVLTKVRHRNLVSLLGYCLCGSERILVYEYMPQGALSKHLFDWREENLKPLEWKRRLRIALDVARGVEYLHSLAHQTFIHRDLKPSNILLGDDMTAKVADFGLVRLAPADGKCVSVETRLAGTFGYLAPEYAVTGRVTTKADVFSFGVILMELITGRKALDETQPEESMHLVTWFRRTQLNKEALHKAIDPAIDLEEDILSSINTVAELAGHCTVREPQQRPDMGHAVNILSNLLDVWKPSNPDMDGDLGLDGDMTLPEVLERWKAFDSGYFDGATSSFIASSENTQTSIPTRPSGFAESFTSADGR